MLRKNTFLKKLPTNLHSFVKYKSLKLLKKYITMSKKAIG